MASVMLAAIVLLVGILSMSDLDTDYFNAVDSSHRRRQRRLQRDSSFNHRDKPMRILYTITTLAEYDNGSRSTTKGYDRMQNGLIPVMQEGVHSLLESGFEVDVYIVAHFTMTREHLLRQALPDNVGLRVWDEASPHTYDPGKRDKPNAKLQPNTLGLARQHRFVVKDNLFHYDFFVCLEDDMIIKGEHVKHHLKLTQQLFRLRKSAPPSIEDKSILQSPSGVVSKGQLQRLFPGLMRVEVLLDEARHGAQKTLDPVPVALPLVNVSVAACCQLTDRATSPSRPASPTSDQVFVWETGSKALGVRSLPPPLGVVALLRGPQTRQEEANLTVADYWAGQAHNRQTKYFGDDRRPRPGDFAYINNQGGWMATRQQIWEWDTQVCLGGFLPPYDAPHFNYDGLDARNVEWWSGAMSLFTSRHACNMHRIISLHNPEDFSKHLIYHSANNKQRQLSNKRDRFVKIDNLYGQLQTAKQNFLEDYPTVET